MCSSDLVKISAAHALYLLGDRTGVPLARKYLKDGSAGIRKMSVDILGAMGEARDLAPLQALSSDPDPQIQQALALALPKLKQSVGALSQTPGQVPAKSPVKKKVQ